MTFLHAQRDEVATRLIRPSIMQRETTLAAPRGRRSSVLPRWVPTPTSSAMRPYAALIEAGFANHELTGELGTVGSWDFDGALPGGYTAHPKRDPASGELHAASYFFGRGNQVQHSVIDGAGHAIGCRPSNPATPARPDGDQRLTLRRAHPVAPMPGNPPASTWATTAVVEGH